MQFAHEIHPAQADKIWRKIYDNKRSVFLKATEKMSISSLDDPAALLSSHLSARGIKHKMNVLTRVIEACSDRNRGRILAAFDRRKNLAAGWDEAISYYMLTTRTP
jgi:hypothetical protein